jgi:hypothetical protein
MCDIPVDPLWRIVSARLNLASKKTLYPHSDHVAMELGVGSNQVWGPHSSDGI